MQSRLAFAKWMIHKYVSREKQKALTTEGAAQPDRAKLNSFYDIKLDKSVNGSHHENMREASKSTIRSQSVMGLVRHRIEQAGERLWRFDDFRDLPSSAVAQALSRLTREGTIERLSKGVYYRHRETAFGKSRPNPAAILRLVSRRKTVFPSGIAAANLLGFTTQVPRQREIATSAHSLPRKLIGIDTLIHTRRPEAWSGLTETEAALLDFLRNGGRSSDLGQDETVRKLLALLSEQGRLRRLLKIADSEPPRIRAMLGALGEQLGLPGKALNRLRTSLNPLSRFDFGILAALPNAGHWQAKERRHPGLEGGN
jgi:hypothetical protein